MNDLVPFDEEDDMSLVRRPLYPMNYGSFMQENPLTEIARQRPDEDGVAS